jgi:hypothetical protein
MLNVNFRIENLPVVSIGTVGQDADRKTPHRASPDHPQRGRC